LKPSPAAADAIDEARIEALFTPLAAAKGLLLAVSGGPDSTALLIMASHWAKNSNRPLIEVATVDHGLRSGARAEAEAVGDHARRRGFKHHVIEWRGEKPASRIQERAREARYQLLAERAKEIGADYVVTAHHADDQIETILFRLLRGSAVTGLKGMEMFASRHGVTLARPLLSLRKTSLVAYCREQREAVFDDPANADPRFARTRMRGLASLLADSGFGPEAAERLSRRAARMDEAVVRATDAASKRLKWDSPDEVRDANALFDEPPEVAFRLLRQEIARISGREAKSVRLEQVEALGEALRLAAARRQKFRATLGGASLFLSPKGALKIDRAPPRQNKFKNS
jgi:tRNA(Ile)-lysidine synthase